MMSTRFRSPMWKHFSWSSASKQAKCCYCAQILSISSGSVGNLGRHMRKRHPGISLVPVSEESCNFVALENTDDAPAPERRAQGDKKIFERVRRYCVALVKECGRPIELIDDAPFKKLLNLIVFRDSDRKQLSASAIKEYMETSGDVLEETAMDDDEHDVFDNDGDSDYAPPGRTASQKPARVIKGEKLQCNCLLEQDDGDHKMGCPLASVQHYWAYFEVSVDDAMCKECNCNVKWTTMSDLKSHLDVYHSHLPYKDDDDNFTEVNRTQSDTGSIDGHQVAEEVYIETEFITKPQSTGKKRKLPSFPTEKCVTLKDNQTITLDRFKCLDRFGLYIAALMKMIPEDKCIKYQEQIVNRLLKEQAAAG